MYPNRLQIVLMSTFILYLVNLSPVHSQSEEFPIGLVSSNSDAASITSTNTAYYNLMKELGANWLIIQPDETTKQRYKDDQMKIISFKLEKVDSTPNYIYHYSGGYYRKWLASESISTLDRTGLKQYSDVGEFENGYWVSQSTQNTGLLLSGPNYRQDKIYRVPEHPGTRIDYIIKIKYKLDTMEELPAEPADVCSIFVEYNYKYGTNMTEELTDGVITTNDATGQFKELTLSYDYQDIISAYGEASQKPIENSSVVSFYDNGAGHGLNIRFEYKGLTKISIDHIEIYDDNIGSEFINSPNIITQNCSTYISKMQNKLPSTFRYWYSLDEPQTLDNYYPYNFVNNILKNQLNAKPIITTFYPRWGGKSNGDFTIEKFIEAVDVDQFYFYYYPIYGHTWSSINDINASIGELNQARNNLQNAYN